RLGLEFVVAEAADEGDPIVEEVADERNLLVVLARQLLAHLAAGPNQEADVGARRTDGIIAPGELRRVSFMQIHAAVNAMGIVPQRERRRRRAIEIGLARRRRGRDFVAPAEQPRDLVASSPLA